MSSTTLSYPFSSFSSACEKMSTFNMSLLPKCSSQCVSHLLCQGKEGLILTGSWGTWWDSHKQHTAALRVVQTLENYTCVTSWTSQQQFKQAVTCFPVRGSSAKQCSEDTELWLALLLQKKKKALLFCYLQWEKATAFSFTLCSFKCFLILPWRGWEMQVEKSFSFNRKEMSWKILFTVFCPVHTMLGKVRFSLYHSG